MLSKIRHYVSQDELKSIYYAIFSSHLTYNCQVWGQGENTHVSRIAKLQNKALRIMNFKDFKTPANLLYAENRILKFHDIIKLRNCLFVHDFINGILPDCFQGYFTKLNFLYESIETRSSSLGALYLPGINTTLYGLNSITYKAVHCWNHISNAFSINLSTLSRQKLKKKLSEMLMVEIAL